MYFFVIICYNMSISVDRGQFVMREFFGFGGYMRTPEGYMSWQHLTFVTSMLAVMAILAVFFGLRNRKQELNKKNLVLVFAAIAMNRRPALKP